MENWLLFFPSKTEEEGDENFGMEECPICLFLFSGGLNKAKCCSQGVCTECYIKTKPHNTTVPCPFCNCEQYDVVYHGPPTKEEIESRVKEIGKIIEIEQKVRKGEMERTKEFEELSRSLSELTPNRFATDFENDSTSIPEVLNDNVNILPGVNDIHINELNLNDINIDDLNLNNDINNDFNLNHDINNNVNNNINMVNNNHIFQNMLDLDPVDLATQGMTPDQVEEALINEAIRLSLVSQ